MKRTGKIRTSVGMIAAVATIGLLSACGAATAVSTGSTGSSTKTVMRVAVAEPYSAYPLFVGIDQGFFKDAGITAMETTTFTSIPAAFTAISKDQMDVGTQGVPAVVSFNAATNESPMKLLTAFGVNLTSWSVGANSGMPKAADAGWEKTVLSWKGKTIGVPAIGGIMEKDLRFMLKQVGLDPDNDVKIASVGAQAAAVAAFKQGTVDIIGGGSSVSTLIAGQGLGYAALKSGEGPDSLRGNISSSAWVASQKQLSASPEFYKGIVDGITKARAFIADPAHKADCVRILIDKVGLPKEAANAVYEADRTGIASGQLTQASFDKSINALVSTGILAKDAAPSYQQLVATEIAK